MKKAIFLVAVAFLATNFFGCTKKKKDDMASMEEFNGVASENVISITDSYGNAEMAMDSVPVVVENAENTVESLTAIEDNEPLVVTAKPSAKQIQQALKNAGFYDGKIDGDIGPRTKRAIEAFQSQNGLKADGKVGVKTWRALSEHLGRNVEIPNPSADVQAIGQ